MSLRHELWEKSSPTRLFIDEHFVFQPLSRNENKALKGVLSIGPTYPDRFRYTIAGTAADLMIRGLFDIRVHENGSVRTGLDMLGSNMNEFGDASGTMRPSPWSNGRHWTDQRPGRPPKTKALIDAFETLVACKKFDDLDETEVRPFTRFCILFAWIDHFRRGGPRDLLFSLAGLPLDEQLAGASTPDLEDDVRSLTIGFKQRHGDLIDGATSVASGKTLAGSRDVNGADFDFVIDGTLFELKTTVKPAISVEMLRQAVGYWLLDYPDEFAIRRVAIDLPRQRACRAFGVRDELLAPQFRDLTEVEIRERFRTAVTTKATRSF